MKYLYISTLSSERLIRQLHEHTGINPGYAVQKFGRLLVKGLVANGLDVNTLSAIPVIPKSWNASGQKKAKKRTVSDIIMSLF